MLDIKKNMVPWKENTVSEARDPVSGSTCGQD